MISTIIGPPTAPRTGQALPPPVPPELNDIDQEILVALREPGGPTKDMWRILNRLAAESGAGDREDLRNRRREYLDRLQRLIRLKVVVRVRSGLIRLATTGDGGPTGRKARRRDSSGPDMGFTVEGCSRHRKTERRAVFVA